MDSQEKQALFLSQQWTRLGTEKVDIHSCVLGLAELSCGVVICLLNQICAVSLVY